MDSLSIAFDLGSTTLSAYLCAPDKDGAHILRTLHRSNPQIPFGADILSRVSFSQKGEKERMLRRDCLGEEILSMGRSLLPEDCRASRIVLVGNPVILGSVRDFSFETLADEILRLPPIGNYVGADALAASFYLERSRDHKKLLLMDIGTNGEIVLLTDEKKLATSVAAGPALEGGNISCGMRGEDGAVDHISVRGSSSQNRDLAFHVIGEVTAKGLCGSGLLSLIQLLLAEKVIDNKGYLRSRAEALSEGCSPRIAGRIMENSGRDDIRNNGRYFKLTESVTLFQEDIHEVQLAVSALRTGTEMLLKEALLTETDIDGYHLAGSFGSHVTVESVLFLGILPDVSQNIVYQSGNLAGLGAVLCLSEKPSEDIISTVMKLRDEISAIQLANRKEFQEMFLEHMDFER